MAHPTHTTRYPRRRLTVDEFERMERAGILHEDDHVELLDGELYQTAAMGSRHIGCVLDVSELLTLRLAGRARVSAQNAVRLDEHSSPQPDIALLRPRGDRYRERLAGPEDILLIIEVADASVAYDRDRKLPLYAAAGIADVWLVDLRRQWVTVYRDPTPRGYQTSIRHTRGSVLSPLAFPDLDLR